MFNCLPIPFKEVYSHTKIPLPETVSQSSGRNFIQGDWELEVGVAGVVRAGERVRGRQ